jgi:hypothetical protein
LCKVGEGFLFLSQYLLGATEPLARELRFIACRYLFYDLAVSLTVIDILVAGKKVGLVCSGGNTSIEQLRQALELV